MANKSAKDFGRCSLCGGKLVKVREEIISGTKYFILKCENCGHEVAKTKEEVEKRI